MSRFQNNRDNILTGEERAKSARKCISLLKDIPFGKMNIRDFDFVAEQAINAKRLNYEPSWAVLQWLRDCVEKYVTN